MSPVIKSLEWILYSTSSSKYPYLVRIADEKRTVLEVLTGVPWPAEGQQVFCIRPENTAASWEILSVVERYPVKTLKRRGPILSVVLDRNRRKRCEFLFIRKPYKHDPNRFYEQIFWRAQSFFKERGVRFRRYPKGGLRILVDVNERYPYEFPDSVRVQLPAGDYAVEKEGRIIAIVERKTFSDFLRGLAALNSLHLLFAELSSYPHALVLVEAPYHYFLDSSRTAPLKPSFCEEAIQELMIQHPAVHLVFVDNRKVARVFCEAFLRVAYHQTSEKFLFSSPSGETAPNREDPRNFIMARREFTFRELREAFPQWSEYRLRRLLKELREEGKITCKGRGTGALWCVVSEE